MMKKISIYNQRDIETSSENRLIKFFKSNSNSKVELSTNPQSVVLLEDGFEICLSPVIVPDICENAIQTVGIYIYNIPNKLSWRIIDITTDQVLVEGDVDENYQSDVINNIVDKINNSNLNIKSRYIYDDGSPFAITNISEEPIKIRFELKYSSEDYFEVFQYFNEWTGINENESYTQVTPFSFEACLSPIQLPPQCATLINTEPLVLKNRFYDYVISLDRYVKIFYRTTNLATGESFIDSINISTNGLVQSDYYFTPNSGNVSMPNEMGITYPRASEILRNIGDRFQYSYNVTYDLDNWQICKPGGYTIGTFLAIETNLYNSAPLTGVKVELVIITNGVENNLGTFTFDKTNLDNDITRIYTFFKSKLTDNGWTVTDETRGDGLFFPRRGLKIVKQIPDDTEVLIKLPNTNGTHLRWDSSTSDWDRLVGSFWKIKCTGGDLNEADTPDLYSITFNPTMIETPSTELGPFRLEFITAEEAGEVLDPNDYDWVALNYDTPLVIETCYLNVPPPM